MISFGFLNASLYAKRHRSGQFSIKNSGVISRTHTAFIQLIKSASEVGLWTETSCFNTVHTLSVMFQSGLLPGGSSGMIFCFNQDLTAFCTMTWTWCTVLLEVADVMEVDEVWQVFLSGCSDTSFYSLWCSLASSTDQPVQHQTLLPTP